MLKRLVNSLQAATKAWNGPQLRTKADPAGKIIVQQRAGRPLKTPRNYEAYAKEGYGKNAIVRACIDRISKAVAGCPLKLMNGDAQIEDVNHPLLKLMRQPNPQQTGTVFWAGFVAFYLLKGDTYLYGVAADTGSELTVKAPAELYCPRPDRMSVVPGLDAAPIAYEYQMGAGTVRWNVDYVNGTSSVLHLKTFNPLDEFYGLPPLQSAAMQADQFNAGGEWNMNVLQNTGRPDGAFVYAPDGDESGASLTADQKQTLIDDMEKFMFGPKNARRPLILDGGIKWESMSLSAEDMDWLEGMRDAARVICLVFGYPPQLLGIPGDNTYSNYEQAKLALYEDTVVPLCKLVLEALNVWLVPRFGKNLKLVVDEEGISALAPRRKEKFDMVNAATFLTINERRSAMGMDKLKSKAADQVWLPSTLIPLDSVTDDPAGDENAALDADGNPIDASADAPVDIETNPEAGNNADTGNVQDLGLNGAQIVAITAILDAVTSGAMAPEAAIPLIIESFPAMDPANVDAMVSASAAHEPPPPPAPVIVAPPGAAGASVGGKPPGAVPAKPKPGAAPVKPRTPVAPPAGKPGSGVGPGKKAGGAFSSFERAGDAVVNALKNLIGKN